LHSTIKAYVGDDGDAKIYIDAFGIGSNEDGFIRVYNNSNIIAKVEDDGYSVVDFDAEYDIDVDDSTVTAVGGDQNNDENVTKVRFTSRKGDILVTDSTVQSIVNDDGEPGSPDALVDFDADDDIIITDSTILASVADQGSALVRLLAGDDVEIDPSTVEAIVGNGNAKIDIDAGEDILVDDSDVRAEVLNNGNATVDLYAGRTIHVLGTNSDVEALVGNDGRARAYLNAGYGDDQNQIDAIFIDDADVRATVGDDGSAKVFFTARDEWGNIRVQGENADIEARVEDRGTISGYDAYIEFDSEDIWVTDSDVIAYLGRNGSAEVDFNASGDSADIIVTGDTADVKAIVDSDGTAHVEFDAGRDIIVDDAEIEADVNGDGDAKVHFDAGDDIYILNYADILAEVNSGYNSALVDFDADEDIYIEDSDIVSS